MVILLLQAKPLDPLRLHCSFKIGSSTAKLGVCFSGTGKSLVLKHILKTLPAASTFVTASTGIAASHLGGTTLHAFAGIGRATDLAGALPGAKSRDARQRWQKAKVLIVDEVSWLVPPELPG